MSAHPIFPVARRVSRVELLDGGIRIVLSDGLGVQITYDGGSITLTEEEVFHSQNGFRKLELSDVA
jgi:hypothetical protein